MGSGMGSTDRIAQEPSIPTSRKVLCLVYGAIAVVGLTATWTNNLAYLPGRFLPDFLTDLTVTPAARSYTGDLLLLTLAAVIFMVVEARRHAIRFVWLYIVGGLATAIAFTFPLFLIARALRLPAASAPRLRLSDRVLLILAAVVVIAHVVWVNVG